MTVSPSSTGPGNKRPRSIKYDRRRQDIVEAAADVFRRKGYSDASIQDIADAVGLLKGSLYHYIDTKEDLLFAVLTETYELARVNIEKVQAMTDLGPAERLRLYIQEHTKFNATHTTKMAIYYHEFDLVGPDRKPLLIHQRQRFEDYVAELILEGQKSGVISAEIDPRVTAYLILGAMNSIYTWYQPEGRLSPDEIGQLIADLLMDGLLGSKKAS